jgi:hypothetical protein
MLTEVKEVLVKAYNSISKVEKYYAPLRRLYKILRDKLKEENLNKELILQIAVKAINNIARLNGLIPTLLVFGTYLRLSSFNTLTLLMII